MSTEAQGHDWNRWSTATSSVVSASGGGGGESLDDHCERLREEWATAEHQRMSSLHCSSTGVDQVTGAVGPLYFAHIDVEGTLVDCMIDPGSSATIILFDLFKEIQGKARIPSSELKVPDVTLRDYSHNAIPIGAQVSLTFKWHDKSVTIPVYVRADITTEGESCLLGTNVV